MAYATVSQVQAGFRTLDSDELVKAAELLDEAAIMIDACKEDADLDKKRLVSCRMVRRSIGDGTQFPAGATQGSLSAGGYTQSWTFGSSGSYGELYLSKQDKMILGAGNAIGSRSPLEG